MSDHQIKISTPADITGLKSVREQLTAIRDLAKEISKMGGIGMPMPGQSGMSPAMAAAQQKIVTNQAQAGGALFQNPLFWQDYAEGMMANAGTIAPQMAIAQQEMGNMAGVAPSRAPRQSGGGSRSGRSVMGAFRAGMGGRGGGWNEEGIAGAAGGLISKYLPIAGPLALGSAAIGLGVSSFNQYMSSGEALSPLTKQITSAGDSLEKLQQQALSAGASLGYNAQQTAQVLNILGTGLGHLGTAGLVGMQSQAQGFARAFGLPATSVAQEMTQAGQLGLTMGAGAGMNNQQFLTALAASGFSSGMQSRMGQVIDEVTQLASQVGNTAVTVPNVMGMMSAVTALNQTGIRTLQGAGGAALLGQASQGIGNPNGPLGAWIEMSAFSQAGFKGSYPEMLLQAGQGAFGLLPNGEMNISAIIDKYKREMPGANFNAPIGSVAHQQAASMALLLGKLNLGLNPNQTQALLQTALSDPQTLAAIQKNLQAASLGGGLFSATDLTNMNPSQYAWAAGILEAGTPKGPSITSVAKQMGVPSSLLTKVQGEPLTQARSDLAKWLEQNPNLKSLTNPEKIDTMYATIGNFKVEWGSGIGTGISAVFNALKGQPVNYGSSNNTQIYGGTNPTNPGTPQMPSVSVTGSGWSNDWNVVKKWVENIFGGQPASAATLPSGTSQQQGPTGQGYFMGQSATPMVPLPNLYGSGRGGSSGNGVRWPGVNPGNPYPVNFGNGITPQYFSAQFAVAGVPGWLGAGVEDWEGGGSPSKISPDTGGTYSVGPLQLNSGGQAAGHSMAWWAAHPGAQAAKGIPPIAAAYKQGLALGIPDQSEQMFEYVLGHSGHPDYTGLPSSYMGRTDQVWQDLATQMSDAAKEMKAAAQDMRTSMKQQRLPHPLTGVNRHQTGALGYPDMG